MSVYYHVYAEVDIDGKWYSLCPYFKGKSGIAKTHSIFWAQSVFTEVYYHLCDYAIGHGVPEDMSEGLREIFHKDLNEKIDGWYKSITWGEYYKSSLIYVNFANAIVPRVNRDKPFKYEGYVLKRELAAFECYEIEEFSEWLDENEDQLLSEKRRHQYVFHRWNDPYGEYGIFQTIADRILVLCDLFADACAGDISGSLYNGITDSQVRVFVLRD